MTEVSSSRDYVGDNKGERGGPGGAGLEKAGKSLLVQGSHVVCVFLVANCFEESSHSLLLLY